MKCLKDIKKGSIVKYGNKIYIYIGLTGFGAKLQEKDNPKLGVYTSKYTRIEIIKVEQ